MAEGDLLESLFEYVGFSDEDAATLRELAPLVRPAFDGIVDEFYRAIERTPAALATFREGSAQIERQHAVLRVWLEELFSGTYDDAYLERRERIGRRHVQIRLDQRYMFGAMNLVRAGLHQALREGLAGEEDSAELARRGQLAIDRICDVELAIMLETYRDRFVEQQRAQERLATLGHLASSIGDALRNPLAVIATSTHLLRGRVGEDGLKHIVRIGRQVDRSEGIIGDLLALAGDRRISAEETDLVALTEDVLASLTLSDELELTLALDPSVEAVCVDALQIRQLLLNLLTNAARAVESSGGGEITVRARIEDRRLVVEVRDDGPGFPPQMRDRVFEPLFTSKSGSVGLGLALCAQIVNKHGGTIGALNQDGGGALVRVEIPQPPPRS